jgi:polysaccharide export outer membrane protein
MKMTLLRIFNLLAIAVAAPTFIASCVSTRTATYFNGVEDGTITTKIPVPESIIHKNDLLSITVTSLNQTATEIFNNPNTTGGTANGNLSGYLVNSEGAIQFPLLGNIKAEGLSKEELGKNITKKIVELDLLKSPIVSIRLLTFKVTVLGEVKNPTVIPVPSEKISLLEAIGLAGDLTLYAKRENVLVIREEDGQKVVKRLNLNSDELLKSPYYYLKSDDVVYVEPNKAGVASAGRNSQWISIVLSGLSVIVLVVDRLIK